ncbi:MAG: mechanosensitive ion channel [Anaerolineae bacterium]|nr:mechanosensitive ion channel [Anaerolineae bacterium]
MESLIDFSIIPILLRLAIATLVLIVGRRLAKRVKVLVGKALHRAEITTSLVTLFMTITYYGLIVLVIMLAMAVMGVPLNTILLGAGIILIVLGVVLQASLSNFAATVMFLLFQPYRVGDIVQTAGVLGIVKEIQLFNTVILTFDNKMVTAPNGKIQDSNIINYSQLGILRADLTVLISYQQNLQVVKGILYTLLAADERILAEPPATVVALDFEDNGIQLGVRPFVNAPDYWNVQFDLRERIIEQFDIAGISIPVPQRDVHLKQAEI